MALLSEIACGIFVLVITVWEAVKLYRLRFKYFSEVWNVLQLSALVLFYIAVVVYTLRLVITRTPTGYFHANADPVSPTLT